MIAEDHALLWRSSESSLRDHESESSLCPARLSLTPRAPNVCIEPLVRRDATAKSVRYLQHNTRLD